MKKVVKSIIITKKVGTDWVFCFQWCIRYKCNNMIADSMIVDNEDCWFLEDLVFLENKCVPQGKI